MDEVKKAQLEQLNAMRKELNLFIESFEKDEVILLDGRMTNEINTGNKEEQHHNELWISIEFLPIKERK
ncbi:hypothetical protein [Mycobacteroides abscessus]|uniref:hypothetical protein n=1 Tax=unclassified Desemzia TaxID=2685243 RepID=UPI0009C732CE|nr:Uncharacterised protein [Mycobacteroides abscessus subsp. abscessus]